MCRAKAANWKLQFLWAFACVFGCSGYLTLVRPNGSALPDIFQSLISRSPRARLTSKSSQNGFHAKENRIRPCCFFFFSNMSFMFYEGLVLRVDSRKTRKNLCDSETTWFSCFSRFWRCCGVFQGLVWLTKVVPSILRVQWVHIRALSVDINAAGSFFGSLKGLEFALSGRSHQ